MKTIIIITVVYCLLGIVGDPAYAALYKYIDKEGILCFADDLQTVPEQYRAAVIIVEGGSNEEEKKISAPAPQPQADAPAPADSVPTSQPKRPRPLSVRLMITAVLSISAVLLFLFISKQPGLKDNKKIISNVRSALIGIVSLYLVMAHARDVMTVLGFAGKAIDDAQQQSAEKGRKAAKAMKQMDALFQEAQKGGQEAETTSTDDDKKQ